VAGIRKEDVVKCDGGLCSALSFLGRLTPSSLLTNMPSDEELDSLRMLLTTYRQTLANLLKQLAIFGTAYAPPALFHNIREARDNIRRIKQKLKDRGEIVYDDGLDEEDSDAPAAKSLAPFQIPSMPAFFVGRRNEVELLHKLVVSGAVVGLVGMGGIGKTTLAIEFARQVRDRFPDGILWARIDTSDPISVLSGFASAFGQNAKEFESVESFSNFIREFLRSKQTLIVLDNAEDIGSLRMLTILEGKCATLITSRTRSLIEKIGGSIVAVGLLSVSECFEMMYHVIEKDRVDSEKEEAEKLIVDFLGRLPLAIDIAVSYLRDADALTITGYNKLLSDEKQRLQWLVDFDDHAKNVFSSIELSYQRLSSDQQLIFASLSIFAGQNFGVEATAAALNLAPEKVALHFGRLVSLSLIEHSTMRGRYHLHPLVRAFLRNKALSDAANNRLVEYFISLSENGSDENYGRLEVERENIMGAITWSYENEYWDKVIRFASTLTRAQENGFLYIKGYWNEEHACLIDAISSCDRLIASADAEAGPKLLRYLAKFKASLADLLFYKDEYDRAIDLFSECLDIYSQFNGIYEEAIYIKIKMGEIGLNRGDSGSAFALFNESLRESLQIEDNRRALAQSYYWLGKTYHNTGNFDEAQINYEKSFDIYNDDENDQRCAVLILLASLAFDRNRDEIGKGYLEKAEQLLAEKPSISLNNARVKRHLAQQYVWKGDFHKAETLYSLSLRDFEYLSSKRDIAWSHQGFGDLYFEQGNDDKAEEHYLVALDYFNSLGILNGQGYAFDHLGQIRMRQGFIDEARRYFQAGLDRFNRSKLKSGMAYLFFNLGEVEYKVGNYDKAIQYLRDSLAIWKETANHVQAEIVEKKIRDILVDKKG